MALSMISNFAGNVAHRHLLKSDADMTDSLAKLASGSRVRTAKDDAASMAIGSRLRAEVGAITQAYVNSGQAVSMLQVADGAMARIHDILLRIKVLGVQAGSAHLSPRERNMLDTEYQQLILEIDRISLDTEFNGVKVITGQLDVTAVPAGLTPADGVQNIYFNGGFSAGNATGSYDGAGVFTVLTDDGSGGSISWTGAMATYTNDGTNMLSGTIVQLTNAAYPDEIDIMLDSSFSVNTAVAAGTITITGQNFQQFSYRIGTGVDPNADDITVDVRSTGVVALGLNTTNVQTIEQANIASLAISIAIDGLNTNRADLGAIQNRLEFAANNIATTRENLEAARSELLDLDMAKEMTTLTSKQLLVESGIAMLSQANQTPQSLLRLFN